MLNTRVSGATSKSVKLNDGANNSNIHINMDWWRHA